MRILTCTFYHYYGDPRGIEPQFYYLYKVPQTMGHDVDFFDYRTAYSIDPEGMRRQFLQIVTAGNYDAVFIATHQDEFDAETLKAARKYAKIFAWNSDDEWRWADYSQPQVNNYDFMVTNDPGVYAAQKETYPNLLHAQWACTGFWNGTKTTKDIPFSFVGAAYGPRLDQIKELAARAGLQAFGKGTGRALHQSAKLSDGLKSFVRDQLVAVLNRIVPQPTNDILNFEEVNAIWNRSAISFTPLDSSQGGVRQIKSRIFDMGLSGTLMLAHNSPHLNDYYEPNKEYVPFETIDECIEKANYYLAHESERSKIAEAYAKRTKAEHMWEQRIRYVLKEADFKSTRIS